MKSEWQSLMDYVGLRFHRILARSSWESMAVRYEHPYVDRLWTTVDGAAMGSIRLLLHRIHPCDEGQALWHPHPWPSIVRVLPRPWCTYEMGVGSDEAGTGQPRVATVIRTDGGLTYDMLDPAGWHYVRPIGTPSYSIMLTGKPWGVRPGMRTDVPKQEPLSDETRAALMTEWARMAVTP